MNNAPQKKSCQREIKRKKRQSLKKQGEKKLMKEKGENNRFFKYSKKFVFGLKDLVLVISLTTYWVNG